MPNVATRRSTRARGAVGRARRNRLFAIALLGMLLRIAVPAGYMPAALADGWFLQLCPDGLSAAAMVALLGESHRHHGVAGPTPPAAATAPADPHAAHAHHGHHSHHGVAVDPQDAGGHDPVAAAGSTHGGVFDCDLGGAFASAADTAASGVTLVAPLPGAAESFQAATRAVRRLRFTVPPARGPPEFT